MKWTIPYEKKESSSLQSTVFKDTLLAYIDTQSRALSIWKFDLENAHLL